MVAPAPKKGIIPTQMELSDEMLVRPDEATERVIALDAACRNEFERAVVTYFCMGNTRETIADKCGCTTRRVKKVLRRVKNRLLRP